MSTVRYAPLFCCLLFGLAASAAAEDGDDGESPWRVLPIPAREHGYHHFDTRTVRSREAWEAFRERVLAQGGWNARDAFVAGIDGAGIDFAAEDLVLIRHDEGSGSNVVVLHPPRLQDGVLTVTISRREAEIGTADMAYRCFALAVRSGAVERVVVEVATVGSSRTIDLAEDGSDPR